MIRIFLMATLLMVMVCTKAQQTTPVYKDMSATLEERVKDAISRMTTHEKIKVLHAQSKFTSAGVPRLGIRQLNMDDGPHGVREELEWNTWMPARWTNDSIVAFPSLTCLAATWNQELSSLYGHSLSEEFAFRGKDVLLGPGVNIARTPLNGRAFEYMGEDPVLAAKMAVPYIVAAQKNGVACCLKHFVLNDQETDRFRVNVNVSERALREIYLYPFEKAVKEAHVWSVMGSYNLWKGVHCCHSDELLNGILKKEWKWDGALISDWGGTTNTQEAVHGGLDIEMGTFTDGKLKESEFTYDDYYLAQPFEKLINEGKVPMKVLDEKVARVLRLIFRTAMNPEKVIGSQCSEEHYDACRKIAEEGIVMLRNQSSKNSPAVLPLEATKYKKVLIVGENATRSLTQGGGSSELKTLRDSSPLDALKKALTEANSTINIDYAQGYASGRSMYDHVDKVSQDENDRLKKEAIEKAADADLIIFIGGLNKNHKQDCENGDRESYNLSFGQNELITALAEAKQQTAIIVVVTFGGNPYAMPWIQQTDAILHCWYLGSESGTALANVMTGKVSPSGKLPVTFAAKYEDYPYVKFGKEAYPGVDKQVHYKEDIFVGYRGFEKNKTAPLFPFGFGLSYTSFDYTDIQAERAADGNFNISVTVSNTGSVAGKETVQLYVAAPKTKVMEKPAKELKAFAKTRTLKPGESQTLTMTIKPQDLASWDENSHQWVSDSGKYTVMAAASSADIKGKCTINL